MTDKHDKDQGPHGETGNTVQQAAVVSKPTTTAFRVVDDSELVQVRPDPKTGTGTREDADGAADTGSDAMPGRSNAL